LQRYANLYPVAQPRTYLWQGLYLWLQGKERQAHHAWKLGLDEAMRLKMPYECGLAHYEIARHLQDNPTLRQQHVEKANGFFTDLEALDELKRLENLK
jgi:hypothetical protein